ncbi:unnamed protein product [Darwinula stevensoni]|uniref:Uncharacterized protein n=1 Tax=Darwinula stevensoni TaxID=69355 RepID=A0A7R8X9X3_9CRUS|nr:unnamed protein product [Darwinula stevensoni]CAG0889610.1 unnamed protein product [Darwinula stevensoni]
MKAMGSPWCTVMHVAGRGGLDGVRVRRKGRGRPGIEPGPPDRRSGVLPLDHRIEVYLSHAPSSSRVIKAVVMSDVRRLALASESSSSSIVKKATEDISIIATPALSSNAALSQIGGIDTSSVKKPVDGAGDSKLADDSNICQCINGTLEIHHEEFGEVPSQISINLWRKRIASNWDEDVRQG